MSREAALDRWLEQILGSNGIVRKPLTNDASFRKYYRVNTQEKSYVLMDAPSPENPAIFCEIAEMFHSHGVNVPTILHRDLSQGFLLLSDLGDRLYLKELNELTAEKLYGDALKALLQIQACQGEVPIFDKFFLNRQMAIFKEWFLERHLNISLSSRTQKELNNLQDIFLELIEQQPTVFVHRDYHSRNLMITETANPGILDFQDAMKGPITYDLVSLFQDCYIAWPRSHVEKWVLGYQRLASQTHRVLKSVSPEEFLRWFDLTGLQRHLKNLGIFSRLFYRDGKSHYLKDIPLVRRYISETVNRYEELKSFQFLFDFILNEEDPIACAR